MPALARRRTLVRAVTLSLVIVAVAGVVLSGTSLPHSHQPWLPGLYNQEHDLTLMGAIGGLGLLSESPALCPIELVILLVVPSISWLPRARPRRRVDSRAPPVR